MVIAEGIEDEKKKVDTLEVVTKSKFATVELRWKVANEMLRVPIQPLLRLQLMGHLS